jgi:hypothetical protein
MNPDWLSNPIYAKEIKKVEGFVTPLTVTVTEEKNFFAVWVHGGGLDRRLVHGDSYRYTAIEYGVALAGRGAEYVRERAQYGIEVATNKE